MGVKYMDVYYDILNKMEQKIYPPLSKLPSESEMMKRYNISRDTARKALALLEQNGYIQKSRGKAAVVLDYNKLSFPVSGLTSFTELATHERMVTRTEVTELSIVNGEPGVMKKLELTPEEDAHVLVRVREIDGEKIILDKDYIKRSIVPALPMEKAAGSLYDYFERELGLRISFAKKEITVRYASPEDNELLDMKNYDMIVIVKSSVYLEDLTLFQYTESRHRPDKFTFTDFARRMPAAPRTYL